jgi:hypothetical protein
MSEILDYEAMYKELIMRMSEEELIRMIRRSERNTNSETPLSNYLRLEVHKRRTAVCGY